MDLTSRPQRKVAIADHIWSAFEEMASQMGSDRDALINQAMFMFARLNGFMDSGGKAPASAPGPARPPPPGTAAPRVPPAPPVAPPPPRLEARQAKHEEDPMRREVAERVLETAAELERMIKGKSQSPAVIDDHPSTGGGVAQVDVDEPPAADVGKTLCLMHEGGELDRIVKERFVIGRGKHCDFVISSGKVSREHAAVVRDGTEYFIEDLGSSNGTWHNKQRIKRRKIEDGDEYFICSEKVKFVYR